MPVRDRTVVLVLVATVTVGLTGGAILGLWLKTVVGKDTLTTLGWAALTFSWGWILRSWVDNAWA